MIVNYTAEGWEIVTQRAHGLMAAQIANHWQHSIRTERWTETLLAIAEHDDAQVELERENLLTPQGGPADFKMRKMEYLHCVKTLDFSLSKSTYIALLCFMHLDFLLRGESGSDADTARFIRQQKENRKLWRKQLGITANDAEKDYRLLEWCDALSLLIAQRDNQPEARAVEISRGPDGNLHRLIQTEDQQLTVYPWPFEENSFELYYECRLLKQLQFKSTVAFREYFLNSPALIKRWMMKRD